MIWVDLDNTPHVPLFRPILIELERRNVQSFVTSRQHAQTEDLLQFWKIPHLTVGSHGGKNKIRKLANLARRSTQLISAAHGKPLRLAMSHGSRTHMVAAWWLRIPYLVMNDYEYSEMHIASLLATHLLFPSYIPESRLVDRGIPLRKVIRYEGYKEQVYLKDFVPDRDFRHSIDIPEDKVLVTMRPPSMSANYHDKRSERLFTEALSGFAGHDNTLCLIVNRAEAERRLVPENLLREGKVRFLERAVDGLQLLWSSDIVVSGGGTMNREAALMGVPTYSVFTGPRPAADELLQKEGRLTFVESPEQARSIAVNKRPAGTIYKPENTGLASWIADLIIDLANHPPKS